MGSDTGGIVGKIKEKTQKAYEGLTGSNETIGDADPDLEYEPTPDQKVLHDGMVVLSAGQAGNADGGGNADGDGGGGGGANEGTDTATASEDE